MKSTCKNCGHQYEGNFCNNCGQTSNTKEINFGSILKEIQHSVLQIDKGILYTTKELITRPGHTIREYLYGKRVKHFKPFAYILILSTIYVLLTRFSNKTTFLEEIFRGLTDGMKDAENDKSKENLEFFVSLLQWMKNNYAYTTLMTIPIISLASYWSFYKAKYNYFQHLILNAYVAGQRTAVYLMLLPIVYIVSDQKVDDIIDHSKIALGILLTFWSYNQFFDKLSPISKILRTVLTYILMAIIFFLILATFVAVSESQN